LAELKPFKNITKGRCDK